MACQLGRLVIVSAVLLSFPLFADPVVQETEAPPPAAAPTAPAATMPEKTVPSQAKPMIKKATKPAPIKKVSGLIVSTRKGARLVKVDLKTDDGKTYRLYMNKLANELGKMHANQKIDVTGAYWVMGKGKKRVEYLTVRSYRQMPAPAGAQDTMGAKEEASSDEASPKAEDKAATTMPGDGASQDTDQDAAQDSDDEVEGDVEDLEL